MFCLIFSFDTPFFFILKNPPGDLKSLLCGEKGERLCCWEVAKEGERCEKHLEVPKNGKNGQKKNKVCQKFPRRKRSPSAPPAPFCMCGAERGGRIGPGSSFSGRGNEFGAEPIFALQKPFFAPRAAKPSKARSRALGDARIEERAQN